ncbi:MAG TPA: alkaline phosphatase family protein [Candidatus Binataceae bacterium]|nr:alkaline phosphatase family protein [Candidatus Binataceae bacterium]
MSSPLDTFDHVVVLMLENRSFGNLFGYLYREGVPPGKNFEGVIGKTLSNLGQDGISVPVSADADVHQPYPDPGEEYEHVTMQLFGSDAASGTPGMNGFVRDYYTNLTDTQGWTGSAATQSAQIMRCFAPSTIPVFSKLAQAFAVFDHWFCAVPSQTWCNRTFWNAATSWGWVNNPKTSSPGNPWGLDRWAHFSAGPTIFINSKRSSATAVGTYTRISKCRSQNCFTGARQKTKSVKTTFDTWVKDFILARISSTIAPPVNSPNTHFSNLIS